MDEKTKQQTADEQAAEMAEQMFKGGRGGRGDAPKTTNHQLAADDQIIQKSSGAGALPETREGASGAEGGFRPAAGGKVIDKSEDEDEDDEKGAKEEEDESEKSEIAVDDLMKSMDALEAAAHGTSEEEIDRRAELAKALSEGTLSDEERVELLTLLGGASGEEIAKSEDGGEQVDKGFEGVFTDEFSEDYDVSPFLERFGHAVGASLDVMREDLAKSANNQQTFNSALAKSFRGVAQIIQRQESLIKSLSDQNTDLAVRLGVVERTPVPRKTVSNPGQAVAMQKSFGEETGDQLSTEQIFEGLHRLMARYKDTGGRAANGEPIDRAISRFELDRCISKSMLEEVRTVLK